MKKVPLTLGLVAVVDDEDYERVSAVSWHADMSNLKPRARNRAVGFMHRFILPGVSQIDHMDGDPLNNQKVNLRAASPSQNQHNKGPQRNNTSGYKGVRLDKKSGRWRAEIACQGVSFSLGSHSTPEAAHKAYTAAAALLHGAFARVV